MCAVVNHNVNSVMLDNLIRLDEFNANRRRARDLALMRVTDRLSDVTNVNRQRYFCCQLVEDVLLRS